MHGVKKQLPVCTDTEFFMTPGKCTGYKKIEKGVELDFDSEKARIELIKPDTLRIKFTMGGVYDEHPSHAVLNDDFGTVGFEISENEREIKIDSSLLRVIVGLEDFSLEVFRQDGSSVFSTIQENGYSTLNNKWAFSINKTKKDILAGFGQKTGRINQNGRWLTMWNTDVIGHFHEPFCYGTEIDPYYISIPFFYRISGKKPHDAAGFFIDCPYETDFDMLYDESLTITGNGGRLTLYVFSGPSMAKILEDFTLLTGRMELPPLWSLGHHQCRWEEYDEADIRKIAEEYRNRKIPCDSLWLDIDYMDSFRIFTWDAEKYPEPEKLVADLENEGFKTVTIIDPGIKPDKEWDVFREGRDKGYFCKSKSGALFAGKVWPGHTVFPDFANKETREWWAALISEHMKKGLAGIWIDMNEPAFTVADETDMLFDDGVNTPEHERYHNQYGNLMAESTRDGILKAEPGKRPFILSRAGYAGIQRFAANWMGDNASLWEHLEMSIPMCLGMGICGQPFVGSDVGGFALDSEKELLVRWYQYAIFQPFTRNHSMKGTPLQYPWSFGEKTENLIRSALEMRYSLLPYIYTCFALSAETGEPIQRPMLYDFQDDKHALELNHQFMFGRDILAAPVTEEGCKEKEVYFPKGEWYVYGENISLKGPMNLGVDTKALTIPAFVRAGAIIPTAEPVQSTSFYSPEEIVLNLYIPLGDGEWKSYLYEDDGNSFGYRKGEYFRSEFTVARKGRKVSLTSSVTGRGFPGFTRKKFRIKFFGEAKCDDIAIPNRGEDFEINFEIKKDKIQLLGSK